MRRALFFIFIISSLLFLLFIKHKQPKERQTLCLNIKEEPKTMDPRKGGDIYSSQMHFLLFEGLLTLSADRSIQLAQAKSYEISEDKLTYTFHLRDTVWSNNTPVTAYDFEQSWKDILRPDFPSMNAQLLSPIKNAEDAKKGLVSIDEVGIKAIDAKTLVITLERPTPYFCELLCFCVFSPVNIENDRKNPNWAYDAGPNFLTNGLYLLEKWDHENQIIAVHNPYRKKEALHPNKIIFNIVQNDQTTLQMFEDDLIDMIGGTLNTIPLEAIPLLEKKWEISRKECPTTRIIAFNTDKVPFNHSKIRQAFALAINRQELIGISDISMKKGMLTNHINPAYKASLAAINLVHPCLKENRHRSFFKDNDVNRAKILLAEGMSELGITKEAFDPVILYYYSLSSSSVTSQVIQVIQQQWMQTFGILIKIECLSLKAALDRLTQGDYFISFTHWTAMYHDPMSILERFKYKALSKNFTNWENQEYIQLLNRSFYEEGDMRFKTLEEAEKLLLKEMPLTPLYHEDDTYIIKPHLPFKISLWGGRMLLSEPSKKSK
jgi:oligopeptide transport system substrate-binding protein